MDTNARPCGDLDAIEENLRANEKNMYINKIGAIIVPHAYDRVVSVRHNPTREEKRGGQSGVESSLVIDPRSAETVQCVWIF